MENNLRIQDLIDLDKIAKTLESFSNLTNIVTAILDLEGNILVQTGWREICTSFHRKNPETAVNCRKSDTVLAGKLADGVHYNVYKCLNGLVDIAVPIVVKDVHIGNLFTGQFLLEPADVESFRDQSVRYGFATEGYLRALSEVPVIDENRVKDIVGFLQNLTEMFAEIGLSSVRLKETNLALEESKAFNETLLNASPDVIYVYNLRTRSNEYSNDGIQKILGYTVAEIKEMGGTLVRDLMHEEDFERYVNNVLPRYYVAMEDEFIEHEYRMKHKDGSWVWLHAKETVFSRDERGEPVRIFGISDDITVSRRAREEISKIQHILEETGNLAKVGGWEFDVETGEGTWTKEVAQIHDLDPAVPVNKGIGLSFYAPESKRTIELAIEKAISRGEPYDLELELVTARGVHKWVRSIGRPVQKNGKITMLRGSFQDITRIKDVQNQLEANSNFLDTIIRSAAVSMWISDAGGTVIEANGACLKLFGATEEEVVGKYSILQDNVVKEAGFMPLVENVFQKGEMADFTIDYNLMEVGHVQVKEGTRRVVRSIITPVFGINKEVTHAIVQSIDLSEIKQFERELILAKEKAEESDKLKTAFLANMSHEIRTPMNGILGFADLLKDAGLSADQQKRYIEIIEKSGRRMLHIISDLIDISKIETGQVEIIKEKVEINPLLEELQVFFLPEARKRGLSLILDTEGRRADCHILTDRIKITQVLTNLIGNALKFTKEGSVRMGCSLEGDQVVFQIRDTGIGISFDLQERIFERFVQGDLNGVHETEGSGLGLAISKAFVEKMGGRMWVESERGKGSVFSFCLPYLQSKRKSDIPGLERSPRWNAPRNIRILIAEDDEHSFLYLNEILSSENIEVLRAVNGREAVELCRTTEGIQLVLMDVKMPVLNGLEATKQIKLIHSSLPVIAQSAFITARDKESARLAGCDAYIEKPVRRDELYAVMKKFVT
ncbi:MAG: PocR ligand-binding domain-containing protein [Bacteroidales bacterium]